MRQQLAWILRGAGRTQDAFDDQGGAIHALQHRLAELESAVARTDAATADIVAAGDVEELTARLEALSAKLDRIDHTVEELVRVVAPPATD